MAKPEQSGSSRLEGIRQWKPFGSNRRGIVSIILVFAVVLAGIAILLNALEAQAIDQQEAILGSAGLVVAGAAVLLLPLFLFTPDLIYRLQRSMTYDEVAKRRARIEAEQHQRERHRQGKDPDIVERRLRRGEKPHLSVDGEIVFGKPTGAENTREPRHRYQMPASTHFTDVPSPGRSLPGIAFAALMLAALFGGTVLWWMHIQAGATSSDPATGVTTLLFSAGLILASAAFATFEFLNIASHINLGEFITSHGENSPGVIFLVIACVVAVPCLGLTVLQRLNFTLPELLAYISFLIIITLGLVMFAVSPISGRGSFDLFSEVDARQKRLEAERASRLARRSAHWRRRSPAPATSRYNRGFDKPTNSGQGKRTRHHHHSA